MAYASVQKMIPVDVEDVCGDEVTGLLPMEEGSKAVATSNTKRWWSLAKAIAMSATIAIIAVLLLAASNSHPDSATLPEVQSRLCNLGNDATCNGKHVHSFPGSAAGEAAVCGQEGVACECIAVTRMAGNMLKSTVNTCVEARKPVEDARGMSMDLRPMAVIRGTDAALPSTPVSADTGREASMKQSGHPFVWSMANRR